ncbi:hypothetical protein FV232_07485 [Methylobacterium sp. WL30]|uniref:hypothetical protein n=1 Tax=unclassified Methylobacterium TaxID=2615210 RepID=UPI0011CB7D51|nr:MULTISPECIES: hypothetical protein [unclassified Methylobacterium]TXN68893.1 hypothetical protein FV232_07485 [Methylobacterium sp. WL30]
MQGTNLAPRERTEAFRRGAAFVNMMSRCQDGMRRFRSQLRPGAGAVLRSHLAGETLDHVEGSPDPVGLQADLVLVDPAGVVPGPPPPVVDQAEHLDETVTLLGQGLDGAGTGHLEFLLAVVERGASTVQARGSP